MKEEKDRMLVVEGVVGFDGRSQLLPAARSHVLYRPWSNLGSSLAETSHWLRTNGCPVF